jgi:aspartyl-tRNA(Asn)/glutamyl-tRNA(Gln) amidotransferase subunit C
MDVATVRHVARLARIALEGDELEAQSGHFDRLLELVSVIQDVELDLVVPMHHPLDLQQPLRPDSPARPPAAEALMALAPESEDDLFLVPRVIE